MPITNFANNIHFPADNKAVAPEPNENELLARIVRADELALKELYCIYYSRLRRFVARINGGRAVDEIINDVMFVVWQKAGTFNRQCRPSTWIFGIAYNKARQAFKADRPDFVESLDAIGMDSQELGIIDSGLRQLEMNNLLTEAFRCLSPEQRAVIELTYFHGMSYQEISQVMDCSENTVKTRMFYARIKLSKVLGAGENSDSKTE